MLRIGGVPSPDGVRAAGAQRRAEEEIARVTTLGGLVEAIGHRTSVTVPLSVLVAGCGDGWASEALVRCGHAVTAIDPSSEAIETCRRSGRASYVQATLDSFTCPWLFDVVCCVRTLLHALEDQEWERAVTNVASFVQFAGLLVVADCATGERLHGHTVAERPLDEYKRLLGRQGMTWRASRPVAGIGAAEGMHVFQRTA